MKFFISLLVLSAISSSAFASSKPFTSKQVAVDSIRLNPPNPDEFAIIEFIGPTAKATFDAMTEIAIVESQIGDDRFFEKQGKNLQCARWELKNRAPEFHCAVVYNDIRTGLARSED